MTHYATVYLSTEPTPVMDSKEPTWPQFYSRPVRVPNGDGSFHWEALVTVDRYEADKIDKNYTVFSTCDTKFLKSDGKPRHVFGSPGQVNDPEIEKIIIEEKEVKPK